MTHQYSPLFIEIMEDLSRPETTERRYNGVFRNHQDQAFNVQQATKKRSLGQGFYSNVKSHRTDPHLVQKNNHRQMARDTDGFNVFVEWLIKNDKLGNIHFPRIYNIKRITDREGNVIHSYDIERLVQAGDVSREEILAFHEHNIHEDAMHLESVFALADDEAFKAIYFKHLCKMLEKCVKQKILSYLKTETLRDAIATLIAATQDESLPQLYIDFHEGNLMWRRGPTGLTLVINDPF